MKALILAGLLAAFSVLAACGVKGPPQRPSAAAANDDRNVAGVPRAAQVPQARTLIGRTTSTEVPGAPVAAPKPERRFILDGLL